MFMSRLRGLFQRPPSDPLAQIAKAAEGLQFSSESDYPLTPFVWTEPAPLTPPGLCKLAGLPEDAPVAQLELDAFLAPMLRAREGAPPEAQARAARYRALSALLHQHLAAPTVYKLGRVEMPVFIVGRLPNGSMAGLRTTVVET